jgi:hypothetical protein
LASFFYDRHGRQNPAVEMTHSAMTALLGPEFDAFLFASVYKESNGGSLSVLSALVQLDVDPWREAAELARMPREAANERLTSLIAALSDASLASLVPATIADRLVKLLPRGSTASFTPRERSLPADPTLRFRMSANMILISVLVMAGVLFAQWAAGLQQRHEGTTHKPASHTTVDQTAPVDQPNR